MEAGKTDEEEVKDKAGEIKEKGRDCGGRKD